MATKPKKAAVPSDEKLSGQDFDLFASFDAIDRKNYDWYDQLTPEQKKKFVPFMTAHWASSVTGKQSEYYVVSMNFHANMYLFADRINNHPKLQWLMFCAGASGVKQSHKWIPKIPEDVSKLKRDAKPTEIKEYYQKVYPSASPADLTDISKAFVAEQRKKVRLAKIYPAMKLADISLLAQLITDDELTNYEEECGNS